MLVDPELLRIRRRFPVFSEKIYLNSCSQGALSDSVRSAFTDYLTSWDAEGSPWDRWIEEYEAARSVFARFIGARPEEVAILPSASAGINSIASALSFRERKKVVLGEFEFPTMGHVWLAQQPRGAEVRFVESIGDTMPAEQYESVVDQQTVVVPVAGLCFLNGWRSELQKIVSCAHSSGALVLLDDYQDCGTRPVNVKELDVDIYVSGTLKYLLGPPGVAFMYVRPELSEQLSPTISGWFAQANPFAFDVKKLDLSPGARRFEAGTPPIPNLYAAKRGVELLESIGMSVIAEHIACLTRELALRTQDLKIARKTPRESAGPLTVLRCKDSEALVRRLASCQIAVSNRRDGLRIACHVYNTKEDIERIAQALAQNLDLLQTDD
jgi:selenocysteine lyase/cysteine desulfurase